MLSIAQKQARRKYLLYCSLAVCQPERTTVVGQHNGLEPGRGERISGIYLIQVTSGQFHTNVVEEFDNLALSGDVAPALE
jgi:hypothetical protein